jgi:hypothetical protein
MQRATDLDFALYGPFEGELTNADLCLFTPENKARAPRPGPDLRQGNPRAEDNAPPRACAPPAIGIPLRATRPPLAVRGHGKRGGRFPSDGRVESAALVLQSPPAAPRLATAQIRGFLATRRPGGGCVKPSHLGHHRRARASKPSRSLFLSSVVL